MKTFKEFISETSSDRKARWGIKQKMSPFGYSLSQMGKSFKMDHKVDAGGLIRKGYNSKTVTTKNIEKEYGYKILSTTDFDKILDAMEKLEK